MTAPTPYLTYHQWMRDRGNADPAGLVTLPEEGFNGVLYNVHETSASLDHKGRLRVTVTGRMRKRDGGIGAHNRGVVLDLTAAQPQWAREIILDAANRYGVTPPPSAFDPE